MISFGFLWNSQVIRIVLMFLSNYCSYFSGLVNACDWAIVGYWQRVLWIDDLFMCLSDRNQAVMIGQGLLDSGWLEPVPNTRDGGAVFKDEYILYQPGVVISIYLFL